MTVERRRIKAQIAGKVYTISGPASQAQMQAVTKLLNESLQQLKAEQPALSTEDAAILVAFNALAGQLAQKVEAEATKKETPEA